MNYHLIAAVIFISLFQSAHAVEPFQEQQALLYVELPLGDVQQTSFGLRLDRIERNPVPGIKTLERNIDPVMDFRARLDGSKEWKVNGTDLLEQPYIYNASEEGSVNWPVVIGVAAVGVIVIGIAVAGSGGGY